jgi:hypothetical protein
VCNFGTLALSRSAFLSNSAAGVNGGFGMYASACGPGGGGGNGGDGAGGALFNAGTAALVNSTFAWNTGTGGNGGDGAPGGVWYGCPGPDAGGNGGNGGSGFGGLCCAAGLCRLTNCTIASNFSLAGLGGRGAMGGGQYLGQGPSGPPGVNGSAGGALTGSGILVVNTLLAGNTSGGNASGPITDGGHNLSSDGTCDFTNIGSLNSTDPKLGLLANNGGPTLTMALLPDSPAIDAGDSAAAPPTDQRGAPRPVGLAADIGAYEYGSPALLRVGRSGGTGLDLLAFGTAGQSCRLLSSSNLSNWTPISTNQIGSDGTLLLHDNCAPGGSCRFYRLVMP